MSYLVYAAFITHEVLRHLEQFVHDLLTFMGQVVIAGGVLSVGIGIRKAIK